MKDKMKDAVIVKMAKTKGITAFLNACSHNQWSYWPSCYICKDAQRGKDYTFE